MFISEFLPPSAVSANLRATHKVAVLGELAALAVKSQPGADPQVLVDTLIAREKLQSTGIADGYAIPHGKTLAVSSITAAVGISAAGVDFQSNDGLPTHLLSALFVPDASHGMHLKALARVARLIREKRIREALIACTSAEALYDLIIQEDLRL